MLKEDVDADAILKDAVLIACEQHVGHHEISGFGTAVRFAKELGDMDILQGLQNTLDREYNADQRMDNLVQNILNKEAIS